MSEISLVTEAVNPKNLGGTVVKSEKEIDDKARIIAEQNPSISGISANPIGFKYQNKIFMFVWRFFTERGVSVDFIEPYQEEISAKSSGSQYVFLLKPSSGEMYIFFHGQAVKGRKEALKIYAALRKVCNEQALGKPYMFKLPVRRIDIFKE